MWRMFPHTSPPQEMSVSRDVRPKRCPPQDMPVSRDARLKRCPPQEMSASRYALVLPHEMSTQDRAHEVPSMQSVLFDAIDKSLQVFGTRTT